MPAALMPALVEVESAARPNPHRGRLMLPMPGQHAAIWAHICKKVFIKADAPTYMRRTLAILSLNLAWLTIAVIFR
jgi:hypothetical protein